MDFPKLNTNRGFIEFIILGIFLVLFIVGWILDRTVFSNQNHGRRDRRSRDKSEFSEPAHPEDFRRYDVQ